MRFSSEPGIYVNLFEVQISNDAIQIMVSDRANYPSLKELRSKIKEEGREIYVYAPEKSNKVYGYGTDMKWLSRMNFRLEAISLCDEPRLTSRMIMEGVISKAKSLGFIPKVKDEDEKDIDRLLRKNKGRLEIYNYDKPTITSDNQVKIFKGYDLRTIFIRDPIEKELKFGLIVDVTYALKDNGSSLNYRSIISRFGKNTLKEIRRIQKDLIPTGINMEVSRQRLIEDIIPFVKQLSEIILPCGLGVEIVPTPCRIILGGKEDETLW